MITVKLKTGAVRQFPHEVRTGGSYSETVSYEGAFVIVKDVWGKQTAFPASDVEEVVNDPEYRGRW